MVHEAVHAGHDALKKGGRTGGDGEVCAYTAEMIFSDTGQQDTAHLRSI